MCNQTVTFLRGCVLTLGLALSSTAGAAAPGAGQDFALKALDGRNYRLSEYRGEVVAVLFWASWCGGCREQLAVLRDLQTVYEAAGLRVLAVSLDPAGRDAASAVESLGVQYPVLLDTRGAVGRSWGPVRLPATYLVDRSGSVRYVESGGDALRDAGGLVRRVRALLDE